MDRRLLKLKEACKYLSLSPWRVRKLVCDRVLPFIQLEERGPFLFDIRDLDKFIESRKQTY